MTIPWLDECFLALLSLPSVITLLVLTLPARCESTIKHLSTIGSLSLLVLQCGLFGAFTFMQASETQPVFQWVFSLFHHSFSLAFCLDKVGCIFGMMTALALIVIVHFSKVYMHLEPGYRKFFGMVFLLTEGMLMLSYSNNLMTSLFGWELIGVASFILIAFYREQRVSVRNAVRIFAFYRVGDFGLTIGMLALNSLNLSTYSDLWQQAQTAGWNQVVSTAQPALVILGCLGVLIAAMVKSAQFPFAFALPRAMEGPTPSSAIFYGALSVHAGVILLIKVFPLVESVVFFRGLLVATGVLSAFLASGSARVHTSVKGRLAMASIAQVGLIFVEIGLGFLDFAIFHTLTHASLRCSQILLSQSVITDYLKLQSKGSASNSWILGHVERYMPDRLRSTFWVLAQQEHMVEYVLTNTSVRLKRLLTSQKFSHWATAVGSVICITAAGFLLVPLNKNFGTTFVLVGSLLATSKGLFGAFSYRGRLASVFVSMMLALSSMLFDSDRLLPLLITSALAVSAGLLLMILVVPPRFCSVQEDFLGMATAYPAVSIVLFALAALLAGVPPSPLFFVEDVIFDHVMQRSLFSVTLMGIIHALNGVLLFKAVASLTFGKLSHVTNTRSRRGDARV